jgi:hypothetical protein
VSGIGEPLDGASPECGCPSARYTAHGDGDHSRIEGSGLPCVHHVGLVVRDREKTLGGLLGLLDGGAFRSDVPFPPARFRTGIAVAHLKLGFAWIGNMLVEVIEPQDDQSLQGRFLKDHGDGLHHLGFVVQSIERQLAGMGIARAELLADGTIAGNDVKWAYIDSDIVPGTVLELIELNPASEQFFGAVYSATGGRLPV